MLARICQVDYVHEPDFAPSVELLRGYQARMKANKKDATAWPAFADRFLSEIRDRPILDLFRQHTQGLSSVCFLCTESEADRCHRRLLAEYVVDQSPGESIEVVHL